MSSDDRLVCIRSTAASFFRRARDCMASIKLQAPCRSCRPSAALHSCVDRWRFTENLTSSRRSLPSGLQKRVSFEAMSADEAMEDGESENCEVLIVDPPRKVSGGIHAVVAVVASCSSSLWPSLPYFSRLRLFELASPEDHVRERRRRKVSSLVTREITPPFPSLPSTPTR